MPGIRRCLSRVPHAESSAGGVPPRRAGFTLAESTAALVVLSGLLLTMVPLVLRVQQGVPGLIHRQQALLTASNLLDELTRREGKDLPLGEWPPTALPGFAQPEELQRHIPGATARAWVEAEPEPPARRVTVAIEWPRPAGQPTERVRLSAWVPASTPDAAQLLREQPRGVAASLRMVHHSPHPADRVVTDLGGSSDAKGNRPRANEVAFMTEPAWDAQRVTEGER